LKTRQRVSAVNESRIVFFQLRTCHSSSAYNSATCCSRVDKSVCEAWPMLGALQATAWQVKRRRDSLLPAITAGRTTSSWPAAATRARRRELTLVRTG
jgi:hypothetical protein